MTVALMWEARAVPGRGEELLAWARQQVLPAEPLRRETFRAPQDRVLVITWWSAAYDADLPELPEPDAGLVVRAVHRWRFESVDGAPADPAAPSGT
ncbi:hypothetical protein [Streptomyces lancefieldiae]|uniref:Uncharacterized protein n=1 Tax=Streptomyces lancefieldiae TaxID=3075520 RepID=A0ABU3AJX7_9ACTN|nr:hypothetical protein [Streptomyces sp. DSM 40712]MDT0610200.1 hypothetical protein [Streptomyces sp. DSM 40712]